MFRLAYRNFGDHDALVATHSVTAGNSVGVRWYEIRSPGGTPTVFQQGTFAPDSNYRWMGSVAMDTSGDIALGYSVSSSTVHPGIRYTGRQPTDPLGMMQDEASIVEGSGSQNGGLDRWGDYSTMSIDPLDDCTLWYTQEYMVTSGQFNWNTRIASFKFANCANSSPGFYLSESPLSQTVNNGQSATYTVVVNPYNGYSGTPVFTLSGCPVAATCTISPAFSGPPNYSPSTVTISTAISTPAGTYQVTVTGTDGSLTHTTAVTLVVVAPDFSLKPTTTTETIEAGEVARYPISLTSLNLFSGNVTLTVSGMPAGSVPKFSANPAKLGTKTTSLLTLQTKRTAKAKTYTLTITGTSGNIQHSTTSTLVIAP